MMYLLILLTISILSAYGLSVALVEKSDDYPLRIWRIRLQLLLRKIHWKLPRMLFCVTCTSFWATLFTDTILSIYAYLLFDKFYFLWPLSGFINLGVSWTLIEIMNALDKEHITNVFIGDRENEN